MVCNPSVVLLEYVCMTSDVLLEGVCPISRVLLEIGFTAIELVREGVSTTTVVVSDGEVTEGPNSVDRHFRVPNLSVV